MNPLRLAVVLLVTVAGVGEAAETGRPTVGLAAVRAHWVAVVASAIESNNRWATRPEETRPVPTSWGTLPPASRTPRIRRQLRAMARMPDVTPKTFGWLVGRDESREVVRKLQANGLGASIETQWRGGQGGGGQTWMMDSLIDHVELATLEHFFLRGQRAARRSGKAAGERTKRNVHREPSPLDDVTATQLERRMSDVAKGDYSATAGRYLLMRDAQHNRQAAAAAK